MLFRSASFINTTAANTHILLDGLLLEVKIKESLEKAQVPEDVFDDRYEIFNLYDRKEKVEEVKMLSEVNDPLLDLENCSLHELISILQKFGKKPSRGLARPRQALDVIPWRGNPWRDLSRHGSLSRLGEPGP